MPKWSLAILLLAAGCVFASCKKDDTEEKQRASIESYITTQLKAPVDEKDGVYLVLLAVDSSGSERIPVKAGDVVEFEYQAIVLGGSVFATSDDSIAARNYIAATRIGAVRVGEGNLIGGLDVGLQRMALGDHGVLIFPFTMGYGELYVGQVPPGSALIFEVFVTKVNDNIY